MNIFILEQYKYQKNQVLSVEDGDIVIDAGACWGDTTLYFANIVGSSGRVYSFEFIPNNLRILKKNIKLNPHLKEIIKIVENPLWNVSDIELLYIENGPSSKLSFDPLEDFTNKVNTLTIDNFVKLYNVSEVDFIKMDIEGAELNAISGAKETLKPYKPKLAISLYHNLNDFFRIPRFLMSLNLNGGLTTKND